MNATLTPEAAAFLAALRAELADLPEDDTAELLEDVEQHVAEADADGGLADLGSPVSYAAELRGAAGLPPRAAGEPSPVRAVRRWAGRVAATRAYREVRAFAPQLRPAWWVARGYLLVLTLAWWTHDSLHQVVPLPHVSGNPLLGLLAVAGAVVASVAWGRRHASYGRFPRGLLAAANVLAAVGAFGVLTSVSDRTGYEVYYTSYEDGLRGPYGTIHDLYVLDAEGNRVDGATIHTQDGLPLAPMVCDRYCPRLTFPLYGDYPSPSPSPSPSGKASPTR